MRKRLCKYIYIPSVAVFLALTTACIHKTGGSVTPWEKVHTYNAALAEANNATEKGAEAVVTSGFASPKEMAPIINWTGQVAMLHQQITSILAQGTATQANIASVKALLDVVKSSMTSLPPSALGLKNPKSAQLFQNDVANIGTLADSLLAALQAVTGPVSIRTPYEPIAPTPYAGGGK
jgi:hypothetical protein